METQKIINLLNDSSKKNLNLLQKMANCQKAKSNSTKFETESIKTSLCDYSDGFFSVTEDITVTANKDTDIAFKNYAPFSTSKTEINVLIDEANHIYIAMPRYKLIKLSDNFWDTSGSLWQFKKGDTPNNNADLTIDNSQSFKYKAALVGKATNAANTNSSAKFKTTDAKLHVPIGTLSTKDNVNLTKQISLWIYKICLLEQLLGYSCKINKSRN